MAGPECRGQACDGLIWIIRAGMCLSGESGLKARCMLQPAESASLAFTEPSWDGHKAQHLEAIRHASVTIAVNVNP